MQHPPRNPLRAALLGMALSLLLLPMSTTPARPAVDLPGNVRVERVDFERHVMGLFGRMGCNAGSCHGSFQGKGGFRLSLFGYDPEKDYQALTRDVFGRRVNPLDPDNSLLLLKATGRVEHGGGVRFTRDSWQYRLLREWLVGGATWEKANGTVSQVRVEPAEAPFRKTGDKTQLRVVARFAGDSEEDITAFCDFRSNDDAVAEVSNLGLVKSLRPGSTAVVVSYRGNVVPVRVLVPTQAPAGFVYPQVPENNYIDREVYARLRRLNMVPSDLASDQEFLRRVTIDTIGCLPSPDEVRRFLADNAPDKRARKIDELLAHPLHAALWATRFCDITGNDTQALEGNQVQYRIRLSQMWHAWFRKRLAENMPYDQIVHGVLCATSREGREPEEWIEESRAIEEAALKENDTSKYAERETLDLFWRRRNANVPVEQWGEKTAAAFMGVRVECAQCHKHPFDRWTQADYWAHANLFGQVTQGFSSDAKKQIDAENLQRKKEAGKRKPPLNQFVQLREIFVGGRNAVKPNPETGKPLPAKALGGPEIPYVRGEDPRASLFAWLRQPDNPFFARAFVNRVWGHYLGVGLVDPVDNFSLANPPSNEKLLDQLARDFVEHKFDIRHLERVILNSRVYQQSSLANATNKLDKVNYARSYVRPMLAEVVVDVVNSALGVDEKFGNDVRPKSRAIEVGASQLANPALTYIFRIFGRPPRTAACDCERSMEPALPQKLFLMTDKGLLDKFSAPEGRLSQLLQGELTDEQILEELFLATLTRLPTQRDRELFAVYRARQQERRAAFTDTLWALINTREFILNH
jgi:hypothetical protein